VHVCLANQESDAEVFDATGKPKGGYTIYRIANKNVDVILAINFSTHWVDAGK